MGDQGLNPGPSALTTATHLNIIILIIFPNWLFIWVGSIFLDGIIAHYLKKKQNKKSADKEQCINKKIKVKEDF